MNLKNKKVNFQSILFKYVLYSLIGAIVCWGIMALLDLKNIEYRIMGLESGESLFQFPHEKAMTILFTGISLKSGIILAIFSSLLGSTMVLGECLYYLRKQKTIWLFISGFIISGTIGFIGGYLMQSIYIDYAKITVDIWMILIRSIGLTITGMGIGLVTSIIAFNLRRLVFSILGGAFGGLVASIIFNLLTFIIEINDSLIILAVQILLNGISIAFFIGLFEQYAKRAWLKVVKGKYRGKEYLIFSKSVPIVKLNYLNEQLPQFHCEFNGIDCTLTDNGSLEGIFVNGTKIGTHVLSSGDTITTGDTIMEYYSKYVAKGIAK